MTSAFWHISSNFGDSITPYILEKLKIPYQYVDKGYQDEHYIMCGSILTACNEHSIIWGAGIAQPYDLTKPKQILAVRGRETRKFLLSKGIDCPEVYGDPAMILPLLYNPVIEKTKKVGIVPHMADQHIHTDYIDITLPVESFIDEILKCEQIISSSLHAIITAHAYGIPWGWWPSPNVIGCHYKYDDFTNTDYDTKKFINSFPFKKQLHDYQRKV